MDKSWIVDRNKWSYKTFGKSIPLCNLSDKYLHNIILFLTEKSEKENDINIQKTLTIVLFEEQFRINNNISVSDDRISSETGFKL